MTTRTTPPELSEACRRLRKVTGDSQQAFATRLGLSIRAIVNYENGRKPSPESLAVMAHMAAAYLELELAHTFWISLPRLLQYPPDMKVSK